MIDNREPHGGGVVVELDPAVGAGVEAAPPLVGVADVGMLEGPEIVGSGLLLNGVPGGLEGAGVHVVGPGLPGGRVGRRGVAGAVFVEPDDRLPDTDGVGAP